ncbi:binding-protein-dependent transport systems inner membrane component [Syntrophobotulus glycolicus DSM 8271]|uniref:Binding-protein-dependent transport systems inner membrane component n=1 Tax=Syntrophobotulus glycolicus (strain DSM 8271 / FlGlyR) TaxID=645991 RepID=F0SWC0_SYNGF|nr:ABC transporter permease subunit [Syntrophobotulus glycolicus]ADY55686.1 binding-protein-dependent transport systems inner membrane component [Syntrophobotulus glycolicus DSM 8271]
MKIDWKNLLWPAAFGIIFILAWQLGLFHKVLNLKPFQLPIPSEIVSTLWKNLPKALSDCGVTISGAIVGMVLGSLIGFMIAAIATFFPKWGYGGMILITAFNAVPIVALSPIMNLWFSTGMGQKIGVVTVVCMAAMAINAYGGLNNLKPFSLDLMHSVAADKWTIFKKLRLPNSLPYLFTAAKINIAASIIAAIISEYFAASTSGLGFGIKDNLRKAEMAMGWSYIVVASLAGVILYCIILLVERDAIKWHASQK